MAYTNEEIEIKFSKKDTIYLTIILILVCIIALVCILVPRYYKLQQQTIPPLNNESTGQAPSTQDNSTSSNNEADSSKFENESDKSTDDTDNSADNDATDSDLSNSTDVYADKKPDNSKDKGSSTGADSTDVDNNKSDSPSSDTNAGSAPSESGSISDEANNSTTSDTDINQNNSEDKGPSADDDSTGSDKSTDTDDKNKSENSSDDSGDNPTQENPSEADKDPAYYTIQVIQTLKNVDMPYSATRIYLNSDGTLNYALFDPTPLQMEEIEALAKSLYELINSYTSNGTELSTSLIGGNDELYNAINAFTKTMDSVADN